MLLGCCPPTTSPSKVSSYTCNLNVKIIVEMLTWHVWNIQIWTYPWLVDTYKSNTIKSNTKVSAALLCVSSVSDLQCSSSLTAVVMWQIIVCVSNDSIYHWWIHSDCCVYQTLRFCDSFKYFFLLYSTGEAEQRYYFWQCEWHYNVCDECALPSRVKWIFKASRPEASSCNPAAVETEKR